MPEYQLAAGILGLSYARTWDKAKLEWRLAEVYEAEEAETCLCGHYPIIEICVLLNHVNRQKATVGNCCVKKFIGLPSDKIFQAIKRVRKTTTKSLNAETIEHAFDRGWITEWERNFYSSIMRKRSLSKNQSAKKIEVNERVLACMRRR
jgi:hypothetical protein